MEQYWNIRETRGGDKEQLQVAAARLNAELGKRKVRGYAPLADYERRYRAFTALFLFRLSRNTERP